MSIAVGTESQPNTGPPSVLRFPHRTSVHPPARRRSPSGSSIERRRGSAGRRRRSSSQLDGDEQDDGARSVDSNTLDNTPVEEYINRVLEEHDDFVVDDTVLDEQEPSPGLVPLAPREATYQYHQRGEDLMSSHGEGERRRSSLAGTATARQAHRRSSVPRAAETTTTGSSSLDVSISPPSRTLLPGAVDANSPWTGSPPTTVLGHEPVTFAAAQHHQEEHSHQGVDLAHEVETSSNILSEHGVGQLTNGPLMPDGVPAELISRLRERWAANPNNPRGVLWSEVMISPLHPAFDDEDSVVHLAQFMSGDELYHGFPMDDNAINRQIFVPQSPRSMSLSVASRGRLPPAGENPGSARGPTPTPVLSRLDSLSSFSPVEPDGEPPVATALVTSTNSPQGQGLASRSGSHGSSGFVALDCAEKRAPSLLDLPIEILRYVIDYYLAIHQHNTLRLICRGFNALVVSNCSLWHRRLPLVFEDEEGEGILNRCRLHNVIVAVHEGLVPLQMLAKTYCFNQCCYDAWRINKIQFHKRLKEEMIEHEENTYGSLVFQAIYFPAGGSTCLGLSLVIFATILVGLFMYFSSIALQPTYIAFLPLWVLYVLGYPILYLFFASSSIEPLVLAVILSIGVNLSSILLFFYRVAAGQATMSWISCLTPTLLCFACGATYVFLLAHRWLRITRNSRIVTVLSVLTTLVPVLILTFFALVGAELDGSIIVGGDDTTGGTVSQYYYSTPGNPGVQGDFRLSGLALLAAVCILLGNLLYALQRGGINDLWIDEPLALVVAFGYVVSLLALAVESMAILVNRGGTLQAVTVSTTVGLFLLTTVLNIGMRKNNFSFRLQLYPFQEV